MRFLVLLLVAGLSVGAPQAAHRFALPQGFVQHEQQTTFIDPLAHPDPLSQPHFAAPPTQLLEFGVNADGCTVAPTGMVCPWGTVQFTGEARGVNKPDPVTPETPFRFSNQAPAHNQQAAFTGLVGPSGVVGPSGLVGPAGPVAFGK